MNKSLKRTFQIGILLIILGAIILPKTGLFNNGEQVQSNMGQNNRLPVSGIVLEYGVMENMIRSAGTLVASEEVDISTEVAGIVRSVHFEEGSEVSHGDLLVRIDDSELQAQREKATHQRELIKQSLERQRVLLKKEAISREAFDRVQTDYLVIESEIQLLDTRIAKTRIRAPFDGVIGFRSISPGTYLQPGTRVANFVKSTPLLLEFSVPERYLSAGLKGHNLIFNVAGFEENFEAVVYAVDPAIDTQTRSVMLRATYPNDDGRLLPGMFADLRIVISRDDNVLLVPSEAIIPQMDGDLIFVYENGQAIQKPIQTGRRTQRQVAIVDGLQVGDTVITSGILQLRSGMDVVLNNQ